MWFLAKTLCIWGTFLIGMVLCSRIFMRNPESVSLLLSEESLERMANDFYKAYESNLCVVTTLSILALVFKRTPDLKKWFSQQMIEFLCYFWLKSLPQDDLQYRNDFVIQSVFIFVIRLWIMFLIWTSSLHDDVQVPKEESQPTKKQGLDKLMHKYDLHAEEEDVFLV